MQNILFFLLCALTQANISYWIDKEEIKRGTSYAKSDLTGCV